LGTVPAADLKVDQSASVLIHPSAEHSLAKTMLKTIKTVVKAIKAMVK
jgi:hypothetical protein